MTGREAQIRQAVSRLQNVFPSGAGTWAKNRFEEWVKAVINIDPDAVTTAAGDLIREWTDDRGRTPQPGHLVERARIIERQMHDAQVALAREDYEHGAVSTPAWFARFVVAAVAANIERRGGQPKASARLEPYIAICREFDITPSDIGSLDYIGKKPNVAAAYAAAERHGAVYDTGDAGPDDLRELGGLAA